MEIISGIIKVICQFKSFSHSMGTVVQWVELRGKGGRDFTSDFRALWQGPRLPDVDGTGPEGLCTTIKHYFLLA